MNVRGGVDGGVGGGRTRVAFVGAGGLASRYHYPSVASLPDVEIAAVAELNPERARAAADKWGVPKTYADYRQMLEEVDPQAVYVIMPPQHLFEPVTTILKQGRAVFVEKPPALTTLQTRVLAHYAERHACVTQVGFQRRHIPALTELKNRVEERGPVHTVSVDFLKATRGPALERHAGIYDGATDPLTSDGIHAVDNLRWLAGGEAVEVTSSVRTMYVPGPIPNAITAHVTFDNGVVGLLHFSYVTGRRIFRAEIHGRNATACVDADRESYFVAEDGEPERYESESFGRVLGGEPHHWLGFWHEHRYFIDCVREGRQPHCNFADSVKTMELVDRIYQGQ
jgi:virulence factor